MITFAAILCSLIKMSPGLGIVVAILTTPAMLRTILVAFRQRQSGVPMLTSDKANIFFLTIVMSLGVILAACGAFCVTFFLTCTASLAGNSKADPLVVSFVVGGIVAVAAASFVAIAFWRAGGVAQSLRASRWIGPIRPLWLPPSRPAMQSIAANRGRWMCRAGRWLRSRSGPFAAA